MYPIDNPLTSKTPATILIPDILFLVFGHLARHDLARCLRVSHQFHDIAGQTLYGSKLGVEYGTALSFSIYAPVQSLAEPIFEDHDHDRLNTFEEFQYPYILPTVPGAISLSKTNLLARVRHLTLHLKTNHHFQFYPPTPVDLFPSLHTLTLQYTRRVDLFAHSASSFPHLRPRHIRLTRIPKLEIPYFIYLDKGLGSRVERVTLHVSQSLSDDTWSETRPRLLPEIEWPASMRQLDLVFQHVEERPASVVRSVISVNAGSTGRADTNWDVLKKKLEPSLQNEWLIGPSFRARALRDRDQCRDSTALISIAKVAASAFATGARVRVVGVEDENQVRDGMGAVVRPVDKEEGQAGVGPIGNLREAYVIALKEAGLAVEEARRRGDDMELISLDEYWRESGNVVF